MRRPASRTGAIGDADVVELANQVLSEHEDNKKGSVTVEDVYDSSSEEEPYTHPNDEWPPAYRRIERRPLPRKPLLLAAFLMIVGLGFSFTGLGLGLDKGWSEALPFLILGGIGTFVHVVMWQ
jgi:hypothetical protein